MKFFDAADPSPSRRARRILLGIWPCACVCGSETRRRQAADAWHWDGTSTSSSAVSRPMRPRGSKRGGFLRADGGRIAQGRAAISSRKYPDDPAPLGCGCYLSIQDPQLFPASSAEARRAIFNERNEHAPGDHPRRARPPRPRSSKHAERAVIRQHLDHLDLDHDARNRRRHLEGRLADYLRRFPDDPKAAELCRSGASTCGSAWTPPKAAALLDEMAASSATRKDRRRRARPARRKSALTAAPLDWKLAGARRPVPSTSPNLARARSCSWNSGRVGARTACARCRRCSPLTGSSMNAAWRSSAFRWTWTARPFSSTHQEDAASRGRSSYDGKGWNNEVAVRYGVKRHS